MTPTQPCPHPLSRQDAAALIGVLSRLAALVVSGALDEQDVDAFGRRSVRDGAMTAGEDVAESLGRLNHSVRTALGEYD